MRSSVFVGGNFVYGLVSRLARHAQGHFTKQKSFFLIIAKGSNPRLVNWTIPPRCFWRFVRKTRRLCTINCRWESTNLRFERPYCRTTLQIQTTDDIYVSEFKRHCKVTTRESTRHTHQRHTLGFSPSRSTTYNTTKPSKTQIVHTVDSSPISVATVVPTLSPR